MASDEVTVDLSNYKDRLGGRVMPGRYRVVVEDAEVDTAGSGNKMITVWLRIINGEFEGEVVVDRLVQTPNSLFRTVGFMQAIGLPTPKKRIKVSLRQFIGRYLDIDVDDGDPYNGRVKSEVRGYLRIEGRQPGTESRDLSDLDQADAEGDDPWEAISDAEAEAGNPPSPVPEDTPATGGTAATSAERTEQRRVASEQATPTAEAGPVPDEVDLDSLDLG